MVEMLDSGSRMSLKDRNVRLYCASQTLYGPKVLRDVAEHGETVAQHLNERLPFQVSFGGVVKSADEAQQAIQTINNDPNCIAGAFWAHTFSPSMMWVGALGDLNRPLFHLSTQWGREIPSDLDMNFMNGNQTAHGNREFAHAMVDLGIDHHNIVGYWQDPGFIGELETYGRVAAGVQALDSTMVASIGGRKMRNVAVTDVSITDMQRRLGPTIHDYEIDDLLEFMDKVSSKDVDSLLTMWDQKYSVVPEMQPTGGRQESLTYAARVTLGIKAMLENGGYNAFTTDFETLGRLKQLPGLAAQELMAVGYGFGAEGDVQAASLLRAFQVMDQGMYGASTFSEPYTWDLKQGYEATLNSHMLEISPAVADPDEVVRLEIHDLGIGDREAPPRLVFNVKGGQAATLTSLFNLEGRGFRLTTNTVKTLPPREFPYLPTARILYDSAPDFVTAEKCWLATGASHHPIFSTAMTEEHLRIFARMLGIPINVINKSTTYWDFVERMK